MFWHFVRAILSERLRMAREDDAALRWRVNIHAVERERVRALEAAAMAREDEQ